jgi:hypothetical protein
MVRGLPGGEGRFVSGSNFTAPAFGTISLLNVDFVGAASHLRASAESGQPFQSVQHLDLVSGERWSWHPGSGPEPGPAGFLHIVTVSD